MALSYPPPEDEVAYSKDPNDGGIQSSRQKTSRPTSPDLIGGGGGPVSGYKVPVLTEFEWQQPVLDKDLTAPPPYPTKADRYIVASGATDAWVSQDGNIAVYNGVTWDFTTRKEGMLLYVKDEGRLYSYGTAWGIYSVRIKTVTGTYNMDGTEGIVICNSAGADVTVNLPKASECPGVEYLFYQSSASNKTTLTPDGSDTIAGAASVEMNLADEFRRLISDGASKWLSVG